MFLERSAVLIFRYFFFCDFNLKFRLLLELEGDICREMELDLIKSRLVWKYKKDLIFIY